MACCYAGKDELSEEEIERREAMPFFEVTVKNFVASEDPADEPLQVWWFPALPDTVSDMTVT